MRALRAAATAAVATAALLGIAAAAEGPAWVLLSQSATSDTTTSDGGAWEAGVTPNGRFVLFSSTATDMQAEAGNTNRDLFVRDMKTGDLALVSENTSGGEGNGSSDYGSISNNGRYVIFESSATDLVDGDTGGYGDVFLRDMKTGETSRITETGDGTGGDSGSYQWGSSLSSNGRYAVLYSSALNLAEGTVSGDDQILLYDRVKRKLTLVSVADGVDGDGDSYDPSISANGRFVAFSSGADNLAGSSGGNDNILLYDARRKTLARVTTVPESLPDGTSEEPAVSSNGRYVVYDSFATNLVAGDTNGERDVFLTDMKAGTTILLSAGSDGSPADDSSRLPSMTANGKTVVFESNATNLTPGGSTNGRQNLFLWDGRSDGLVEVSLLPDGTEPDETSWIAGNSLSSNGKWLVICNRSANIDAALTDTNDDYDDWVLRLR